MDKENIEVIISPLKCQVETIIENVTLHESKGETSTKQLSFEDRKPEIRVIEKKNECKQQ